MNPKPLRSIFPLNHLKKDISLMDPSNTNLIWEYYLLENLSCGLIRDSRFSPVGYEGCLAERFYRENQNTWVFYLRELKWSDGSSITSGEVEHWINDLRFGQHRHIQFLRRLKKFTYDHVSRKLTFEFPFSIDHSLLHELSLADSGLTPIDYKKNGWIKTIGPYFVKQWDFSRQMLILEANKYSVFFSSEMPQEVLLINASTIEEKLKLFNSIEIDIAPALATTNPRVIESYSKGSDNYFASHPSTIYYLRFNHLNSLSHNREFRLKISELIKKVRLYTDNFGSQLFSLQSESQMIPFGFSGRLDNFEESKIKSNFVNLKNLQILVPIYLEAYSEYLYRLKEIFNNEGIELHLRFYENLNLDSNDIAIIDAFVGNQLDSSGSWSFLLSPPLGPLSPWLPELKNEFNALFSSSDFEARLKSSQAIHSKILNNAIAIPLLIGGRGYFLSKRVDTKKWNPFDARLRFYELSYK